jgi:hypothetical protein
MVSRGKAIAVVVLAREIGKFMVDGRASRW